MLWTIYRKWKHWKHTFISYANRITNVTAANRLAILVNLVDTLVYTCISECTTYHDTLRKLDDACIKCANEVYARCQLRTCRQNAGKSLEEFQQMLKAHGTYGNFRDVTAAQYQKAA